MTKMRKVFKKLPHCCVGDCYQQRRKGRTETRIGNFTTLVIDKSLFDKDYIIPSFFQEIFPAICENIVVGKVTVISNEYQYNYTNTTQKPLFSWSSMDNGIIAKSSIHELSSKLVSTLNMAENYIIAAAILRKSGSWYRCWSTTVLL